MPSLGADMEAGTLVEWLKKPGEDLRHGDILAVVETQKGAIEIEVFEDGLLEGYLADIGEKVPVGTPIAVIRHEGEEPGLGMPDLTPSEAGPSLEAEETASKAGIPAPPPPTPTVAPVPKSAKALHSGAKDRLKVSPAARRLADAAQLDLTTLIGSGPDGAIVLADVTAQIAERKRVPAQTAGISFARPDGDTDKMAGMRTAIAAAMARSKREIPHYYLAHVADITAAESFVADKNKDREPADRVLLGAVLLKAVASALKKYPEFNGHHTQAGYSPSKAVHLGVAINIRGGGLVAPAIHNAETLDIDSLMAKMRDLVARVRAGRFRGSELSDPTITVSSLGDRGVETMFGVIYPPQVAIIGIGTPVERPFAKDGAVFARRTVNLTLSADHRVSDGHRGALFLSKIARLIEQPETL